MLEAGNFLTQTLVDDGDITEADAERARGHARANGGDVIDALISLNIVGSQRVAVARAKICEYPFVDLGKYQVDIHNASLMPRGAAENICAFPLFVVDGTATVGMLDPLDLGGIDRIRQLLKCDVDPVVCDPEQLKTLIGRAYSITGTHGLGDRVEDESEDLTTGDEPIVAAVNQIIAAAVKAGASDVHINPDEHGLHLRYRVDGVLMPQQAPAKSAHASIVQRLKVMSRLDLTQSRRPQDGKFRFNAPGVQVDVRLSLLPTIHGENVVMRLLRPSAAIGSIEELGMPEALTRRFTEFIHKPHGMILVTGPTGSGKTTTLYTALAQINDAQRNIMTIEDPVEIRLPLIRQVQVNPEVGLTFATALRSVLRQDPDVVLVGEIRDDETARIAVQSALTGHLVLTTLHTNDAVGAVARLKDFAVPPFAINSAVLCAIAQRLVRKVCVECVVPEAVDPTRLARVGLGPEHATGFVRGAGCPRCLGTGYKGRLGVYEMLVLTPSVQHAIEAGAETARLRAAAIKDGFRSLWEDGLNKGRLGLTSFEEFARLRTLMDEDNGSALGVAA